jgi:hypothetical protein
VKNASTYQLDYDQTGSPVSLKVPSGDRNFFILDWHGSVVGLVKDDGTVSGTYTYDLGCLLDAAVGVTALKAGKAAGVFYNWAKNK